LGHRRVLGEEFLSPLIHSLPPSKVPQSGPSSGIRAGYGSFRSLTNLRSKDGVPGMGFESSALRWEELPDVVETDVYLSSPQGTIALVCDGEQCLSSFHKVPYPRIEGYARHQQQGGRLPVSFPLPIRIQSGL
jgi:hypothetical protein